VELLDAVDLTRHNLPAGVERMVVLRRSARADLASVVRSIRHDFMNITSHRVRFRLPASEYKSVSAAIADTRKAGRIVAAEKGQGRRNALYGSYWVHE
jgi:hypothetical protein